jgi:hypothetical protein
MADHEAPRLGILSRLKASARYGFLAKVKNGVAWAVTHRRKVAAAVVVALPLVSRALPDFPSAEVLTFIRAYFGA